MKCGSSWVGFWKLADRRDAWVRVADSAHQNSIMCNGLAQMLKDGELKDSAIRERDRFDRMFSWAWRRAKMMKKYE